MKKQVSLPMSELSPVIEQCIENGSEVIINITGNSMRPFLKDRRDQVVLIKPEAEMLKKLFAKHRFSVVVNLAAQAGVRYSIENPDAYIKSNIK